MSEKIEQRARFDLIRYAQAWEDADILCQALKGASGRRFLSIAAAGDNVLALLTLDPEQIIAADLSAAQLHCLQLRISAMQQLTHADFLELMQPTPGRRRKAIMQDLLSSMDTSARDFWQNKLDAINIHGLAGIGKFEKYFAIFRRFILPLIASKRTCHQLFEPMNHDERMYFFDKKWDRWRWRLATRLFFSQKIMGLLGRDPAFFDYANGNLPTQIRNLVRHAVTNLEPRHNPYMQWILLGKHTHALPLAWREQHYDFIRHRLDRIKLLQGGVEEAQGSFDGFNLSDIFEYMSPQLSHDIYAQLLGLAKPKARFVYWNMMVRRQMSDDFPGQVELNEKDSSSLDFQDKAFFYSNLVIEDVIS